MIMNKIIGTAAVFTGYVRCLVTFLLLELALGGMAQPAAPLPKRIYITLDVSGSMKGNKYVMANYAAQILTVFRNPEDIVTVYYLGHRHSITGGEGYKQLQIPYEKHTGRSSYHEISDISQFLKDYKPDVHYQDWLFIIGDGDWDYARQKYDDTVKALEHLLSKEQVRVCYLQTGDVQDKDFAFTRFMNGLHSDLVDVRRSDTTAVSVLSNCIYFANKILGFSNSSVQLKKKGRTSVTFCSELPLERCLLVYQSGQVGAKEVAITSVTCKGRKVGTTVKGNPTTQPLVASGASVVNGIVWEMSSSQPIPANDTVEVCFNQEIDVDKLTLYPFVDVSVGMRPWSVALDTLTEASPDVYQICDQESQVLVKISVTDKYGHKFPPPLMQVMDVKLSVDGNEIPAAYSSADTTFQVTLPMPSGTISYLSMVECPGYFSRVSPRQTVVKAAGICPPERLPLITLPVQQFSPIVFSTIRDGEGFGGQIQDSLFAVVAPLANFDEQTIEETSETGYFGHVSFSYNQDGTLAFNYESGSEWCECAFPDTLTYLVTLRSTHGVLCGDRVYEGFVVPVAVPMDHMAWAVRCRLYLVALLVLLLLEIYFFALLKKNRFHKTARLKNSYSIEDCRREVEKNGRLLRRPGLGAWINRWLNPFGAERCTMSFTRPRTDSMTFLASDSKNRVLMTAASFNPKTMSVPNYVPRSADDKKGKNNPISISVGTSIAIKRTQAATTTTLGHLKLVSEGKDDEGGFRAFIAVLIILGFLALCFVAFVLIKSL